MSMTFKQHVDIRHTLRMGQTQLIQDAVKARGLQTVAIKRGEVSNSRIVFA